MKHHSQPPVDGGRVSAWQLVLLLVTIPTIEDSTAIDHWLAWRVGVDGWISILLAVPAVVLGVLMLLALGNRHPGEDLAGILLRVSGPFAYPLGILYVALFLGDAVLSVREFGMASRLQGLMSLTRKYSVNRVVAIEPSGAVRGRG